MTGLVGRSADDWRIGKSETAAPTSALPSLRPSAFSFQVSALRLPVPPSFLPSDYRPSVLQLSAFKYQLSLRWPRYTVHRATARLCRNRPPWQLRCQPCGLRPQPLAQPREILDSSSAAETTFPACMARILFAVERFHSGVSWRSRSIYALSSWRSRLLSFVTACLSSSMLMCRGNPMNAMGQVAL